MLKVSANIRFWILVSIVAVSGFSQGMLLPLIAIIFEHRGISSTSNGINAAGLYIGIILISPFMEQPLRKFGYKPIILFGGLLVFLSLALFPLWESFWFWFFLRLLIGIGDHSLHFATQTWITSFSPANRRGRNLSLYGLFFGIGFAAGPLMAPLAAINEALPFITSSILCLIGWFFLFLLKNEFPEQDVQINTFAGLFTRFSQAFKYGWTAFLPTFAYGVLESSLNGSFPVYALRINISVEQVSVLLAAFSIGGIIFQLPLGIMSDKLGRRRILITILFLGTICFSAASFFEKSFPGLFICLAAAGMLVGTTFSLGISYMADLMPKKLFPTGNLMCGIFFSFGSLIGPSLSGFVIQYFKSFSFFHIISSMFLLIFFILVFVKERSVTSVSR